MLASVTGGVLWGEIYSSLQGLQEPNATLGCVFMMIWIVIIPFALFNVMAAVVQDKENRVAQADEDYMINLEMRKKNKLLADLHHVFVEMDINKSNSLTIDELEVAMEDERIMAIFHSLGLELEDARSTFDLLDVENNGYVDIEEFIAGFLHLRGDATARESARLHQKLAIVVQVCKGVQQSIKEMTMPFTPSPTLPSITIGQEGSAGKKKKKARLTHGRSDSSKRITPAQSLTGGGMRAVQRQWLGERQKINKVEHRAITVNDLLGLWTMIKVDCESQGWKSQGEDSQHLHPSRVNLHDLNYNFILPATAAEGAQLQGLREGTYDMGHRVVQTTGGIVTGEGFVRKSTTGTSVAVDMVRGTFKAHTCKGPGSTPLAAAYVVTKINDIDVGAVFAVERPVSLSYKELVSNVPLVATWFVSHCWSEFVRDFVLCCSSHAKLRGLEGHAASYWVCGYANRQNDLESDISDDPLSSSFYKALTLSKGVLLILDSSATPFHRIWCCFELYLTVTENKALDITTVTGSGHSRRATVLSHGLCPLESPQRKTAREVEFPIHLLVEGMVAKLEMGESSIERDKVAILGRMLGKKLDSTSWHDESVQQVLDENAEILAKANRCLNSHMAIAAWPQAVKRGLVQELSERNGQRCSLPEILRQDAVLKQLNMSFAHFPEMTDYEINVLAQSFPPSLTSLTLHLEACRNLSDSGLEGLVRGLPDSLRTLNLDCLGCVNLSDSGLTLLGESLPTGLVELNVHFDRCSLLTADGVRRFATGLPSSIAVFTGTFRGTSANTIIRSKDELSKWRKGNVFSTGRGVFG
eukprot:CAMPEP_0178466008 /NCGR_PEP_ID=MMETSP0689_2-20121128/51666_1 /TAXON_ID=160604 /ORGANISM="Amphidinium massartii, Strain CS-259" /LENGTH=811 /DNA_ID=CAMNT_0020092987 /DNA_START=134 /DNA_END=2566 /DNA_ORIENTATION=+